MSNARYLEIDSTYRDRKEWPLAADFIMPISQTGRKGKLEAFDSVSDSATITVWESNKFNAFATNTETLKVTFISSVPPAPPTLQATTGTTVIIVQAGPLQAPPPPPLAPLVTFQRQKDYYAAAVIYEDPGALPPNTLKSRIISSTYMGTDSSTGLDRMRLTLVASSFATLSTNQPLAISDPTDFTSVSMPWIFVPAGRLQPNAYVNTLIHNQRLNQTRPLKDYQSFTHLARIDTSGSATSTDTAGPIITAPNLLEHWRTTDRYSIRSCPPLLCDDVSFVTPSKPLLTLEGLFPGDDVNNTSFNLNKDLIHRGQDYTGDFLEILESEITGEATSANTTVITLTTGGVAVNGANNFFVGCTITIDGPTPPPPPFNTSIGEERVITASSSSTVTVSPGFSNIIPAGSTYRIKCPQEARRIRKYADYRGIIGNTSGLANGIYTFPGTADGSPGSASNIPGFYTGLYIQFENPGVLVWLRLIRSYTITTDPATVPAPGGGGGTPNDPIPGCPQGVITFEPLAPAPFVPTGPFSITSGMTCSPFSYTIAPGIYPGAGGTWLAPVINPTASDSNTYQAACLLPFNYDNFNPFVYTGSLVSQQDMVCYEIELLNLVLPNDVLVVAGGGNIAYYPYVYVELSNVSASGANLKHIIYSNNPNSTRVLFRAAIDDVPNPLNSSFIKIDGDGAVQTVKFKPNDNLRFRVSMHTGETFETVLEEWFSPLMPNPLAQISAYFSIKRV